MLKYKVLIGCQNDKTGKRFEPGDTVSDKDFPKLVIKHWLEKSILKGTPTRATIKED